MGSETWLRHEQPSPIVVSLLRTRTNRATCVDPQLQLALTADLAQASSDAVENELLSTMVQPTLISHLGWLVRTAPTLCASTDPIRFLADIDRQRSEVANFAADL